MTPPAPFFYVLEDSQGNTQQFTYKDDLQEDHALQMIEKLRDIYGCKLYVYRLTKTIGSVASEGGQS